MLLAVRSMDCPGHTGELLPANGAEGMAFTVTVVAAAGLGHPFTVTVTEYTPALTELTFEIEGFCNELVKPFGPVHE